MTLLEDTKNVFYGNDNSEAKELLELLKREGNISKLESQGFDLLIEYTPRPDDLSCITRELLTEYKLVIAGFDSKPDKSNSKVRLWLRPLDKF